MSALVNTQATTAQEAPPTPDECWVWRQDRADLEPWTAYRADDSGEELAPPVEHPDGHWRTEGIIAVPGVLVYREGGQVVRELVTPEVLHDAQHLEELRDSVVTMEHPPALITPENVAAHNAGNLSGNIRVLPNGAIASTIILRSAELLDAVRSRAKTELSEGYRAIIVDSPGEHPVYGAYDRIQTKRMPNHVAVTTRGRAGRAAAIRLDNDDIMFVSSVQPHTTTGKAATGAAKETSVKSALSIQALEFIQAQVGALRFDAMSDDEAAAKAMEILRGAAGIDGRIGKALGEAATLDELRGQAAALEKALAKVRGDLSMAETEKARLTQEGAAIKTELDTMKADMGKMVEPEAAIAQVMDGVMPPEGALRLDSAKEQALRARIMGSLQKRERAAVLIKGLRLDSKALGLDPETAPIAKVNRLLAERMDSKYAATASDEAIDALLQVRAADLKTQQSRMDAEDDSIDPGLLGLNFTGTAGIVRNDADDAGGAGFALPTASLFIGGKHPASRSSN